MSLWNCFLCSDSPSLLDPFIHYDISFLMIYQNIIHRLQPAITAPWEKSCLPMHIWPFFFYKKVSQRKDTVKFDDKKMCRRNTLETIICTICDGRLPSQKGVFRTHCSCCCFTVNWDEGATTTAVLVVTIISIAPAMLPNLVYVCRIVLQFLHPDPILQKSSFAKFQNISRSWKSKVDWPFTCCPAFETGSIE